MRLAFILFDGFTALDFIGLYDPISRLRSLGYLPELNWDICACGQSRVRDPFGLSLATIAPDNLAAYDWLLVPGGLGTRALQYDEAFLAWLRTGENVAHLASVCTGSLLLGAAGFLRGKRATTHFGEYAQLARYAAEVSRERIVEDGNLITAGAVASSLDLGLFVAQKLAGEEAAREIARRMAYLSPEP